jgi:hypothetical protein
MLTFILEDGIKSKELKIVSNPVESFTLVDCKPGTVLFLTISPEAKKKTQRNGHAAQEESHSQTRGP